MHRAALELLLYCNVHKRILQEEVKVPLVASESRVREVPLAISKQGFESVGSCSSQGKSVRS